MTSVPNGAIIRAMFNRTIKKNSKDLFFVTSSNWESVLEAESASEAATLALSSQLKEKPDKTNISTVVIALNVSDTIETVDAEKAMTVFYAPKILANAGYHEESKNLQGIIDEMQSPT